MLLDKKEKRVFTEMEIDRYIQAIEGIVDDPYVGPVSRIYFEATDTEIYTLYIQLVAAELELGRVGNAGTRK